MRTKNKYSYPVEKSQIIRISYIDSPAHVQNLEHAVDFIVPEGVPVRAALSGVVVDLKKGSKVGGRARRFEKYGNFVEIRHRNNEYSEYEHLSRVVVRVGQEVKRGQIIGYSGKTGWLAHLPPHLHFMVGVYKSLEDYQTLNIVWSKRL